MSKEIDYNILNIDPDILAKAWDGDATSQLLLGKAYFSAVYAKDNCYEAFKWIQLSAEQGNMEAQYRLGDLFVLNERALTAYTDAYAWYTKAALQGYKKALIRIHNLYQQDKKMHCRGRLNLEEDSSKKGSYFLHNLIAKELNEHRLNVHKSKLNHAIAYYTELFNLLKSGDQEDPYDSLKLGFLYQYGYGVKKCIKLAMYYYTVAANQGNRDVQYHLGYLYESETDIKFNYYFALRWYRASATSGNVAAQNSLGYFYKKGLGTELNLEGAIYWYTMAAKAGNSDAQLTLGKIYRKGEGVDEDISEAIKWYTLAANQGSGAAQNCLNQLYRNGKTSQLSDTTNNTGYVEEHQIKPNLRSKLQDDIEKMNSLLHIKQLEKLAEHALRTDRNAMFTLGMKYYNGEDFIQDKEAGFQWMKRAAKAGLQKAELKVAEMYKIGGDVVDQDFHESSIWTTKLVKQKNSVAQCNLGLLYLSGKGVRKDPLEASKWFTKSADQGNAEAQYQFGLLRYEGLGLRKDVEEAVKWFHKSALNGNKDALYELGKVYLAGERVEKDIDKAIKLYEHAASKGNQNAQFELAKIYEKGEIADQDLQKAEKYYELAAESDLSHQYELAKKYMDGAFGNSDYIKAFELFKKIADEELSSNYNVLQTPITYKDVTMDYSKLVDMFTLASERGEKELYYNIGSLYENGIRHYHDGGVLFCSSYTHAIPWYSAAVVNGDYRAKHRLGVMYEEGKGVEVDLAVAFKYYSEASENGIDDATYRMALMYMKGEGVAQDLVKAFCLFTEVSNKGHEEAYKQLYPPESRLRIYRQLGPSESSDNLQMLERVADIGNLIVQYHLGAFYHNENENAEKAIKWLTLASEGGITNAFYVLGTLYEYQKGKNQSYSKAIHHYSEAIKRGHLNAMYSLAEIYRLGRGVKLDYRKAYDLYTSAAKLGLTQSSRFLDITNYSIQTTYTISDEAIFEEYPTDLKSTLAMLEFVAKMGNSDVQYQLANFYMTNTDYLNYYEAFKWHKMAASKENTNAIYELGLLYENGQGTTQDYKMACHLYSKAKEKGHRDAIYRLGKAYHYGRGFDVDTTEAIDCYIKAAELGNNESQYMLGKLYQAGELVGKDTLKTLEWYTKAYLNGNCDVINDLYLLYDEEAIESFFYERLFKILSGIENTHKHDNNPYNGIYGSFYFKLGTMYLNGQGTAKNLSAALKQFLKAYYDYQYHDAESFISLEYNIHQSDYLANLKAYLEIQNQIPSEHQYKLGMLYYDGVEGLVYNPSTYSESATVLAPDYSVAHQYFNLASQKNHADAQDQLGLMYLRGHGVEKDYQKALGWFTASSESMTDNDSIHRSRDFYCAPDSKKNIAAEMYLHRLVSGDEKSAQPFFHEIRLKEIEKRCNQSEPVDQFEKEVEQMEPKLLYERGVKLYRGSSEGVKSYDLSFLCIRKAVEKNYVDAIVLLGEMYFDGKAIEKDEEKAMELFKKSVELIDSYNCYEHGLNFYNDKNYRIALPYLKKAAEGDNFDAQVHLGLMHNQGLGVEKDHIQAMQWFQKSIQINSYVYHKKGIGFYESFDFDNNYEIALLYLKNAAEEDDCLAQFQLGIMHLQGFGVEKNYSTAMERIESSIEEMYESCCFNYSMMFYNGTEVEKNYDIALLLLRKLAIQGYGLAQAQIGLMYLEGDGVSENESEGMEWIKKSIKNAHPNSCYNIGFQLYNQYEREWCFGIALLFIKKVAEDGLGLAQALLGEMYLTQQGIQKSQDEAFKWIEISVRNLDAPKCYDQGMKYYNGSGVEKNYTIALLYLQIAEVKKYTLAKVQIGIMYLEGHGFGKSETKAMEYFQQSINDMDLKDCYHQGISFYNEYRYDISLLYIRKAAEAGYGPAQSQLGIMLLGGKAIQKNQTDAMFWIEKSIESMTPFHCYNQGMALYRGLSVVKDYALSLRFMEKAAENHYGLAQAHLALIYYQGFGVEKNRTEAMKWVEKSTKELTTDECYEQGMKFYNGIEVDQDYEITLLYIQKAIERYHGPSQAQLALMYLEGSGVVKNDGTAMYWIETSMNGMKLAECYRQGMFFYHKNSYDISLLYLKRASKANAYAQAQLGYMYLNGIGVGQDHEEAARWHDMVENNYIGDSRYCRSKIHHCDHNGMQDFSKALKLYREELKSIDFNYALLNNPGALRGIGLLYEYGDGVTQDFKKALKYYEISVSHDNIAACYNIGLLYYYGKGVDQNHKEALFWFTKLANANIDPQQSHVFVEENGADVDGVTGFAKRTYSLQPESRIYGEVHYYIGLMYNNGFFVDQDEEVAQNYIKMAHLHGVERANNLLK